MASQPPRPAWFRLSSLANCAAPPLPPPPTRPPAPTLPVVRPSIPVRPLFPPPQTPANTEEFVPPPPTAPLVESPPPAVAAPPPPFTPATTTAAPPPPSTTATTTAAPPPSSTPATTSAAPSPPSPPASTASPRRSPVASPAPHTSPPAASPRISTPARLSPPPPPAAKSSPRTSPVQKENITTFTNATTSSPPTPKTTTLTPSPSIPTSYVATPISSPKIIKPLENTPTTQSPKVKLISSPPSPLALPPAHVKTDGEREPMIEQKTMLKQENTDRPMKMPGYHNNHGIASNGRTEPTAKDKTQNKKFANSEEYGMRVITLAGENKGAVMELSPCLKKNNAVGNPQGVHKNKDDTESENSNGDGSSSEGKSSKKGKANKATTMQTSFLNSNVQGLNNCILYNCDFQQNNPGIHLSLTRGVNARRSKD